VLPKKGTRTVADERILTMSKVSDTRPIPVYGSRWPSALLVVGAIARNEG